MKELNEGSFRRLPDTELEIMQIIWEANASVTSADVFRRIQPEGRWAMTTVLNFLGRLVEKEFLRTRKQGKCNIYTACVMQKEYLELASREFLEKVHGNSLRSFVEVLYSGGSLEEDDLLELREYMDACLQEEAGEKPTYAVPGEKQWRNWYQRHFFAR